MVRIEEIKRLTAVQKSGDSKGVEKSSAADRGLVASGGQGVDFSSAAALRESVEMMMGDVSDVRMERIEAIRNVLESGRFIFNSRDVATQIVRNALAEHFWT